MSSGTIEGAIRNYARLIGKQLSPHWNAELRETTLPDLSLIHI